MNANKLKALEAARTAAITAYGVATAAHADADTVYADTYSAAYAAYTYSAAGSYNAYTAAAAAYNAYVAARDGYCVEG